MEKIHLLKYLANLGVASRRKVQKLIEEGGVMVNGKIVHEAGLFIYPESDEIKVNNQQVSRETNKVYFLLNKPRGVVSTASDELNRKTVVSMIPTKERIYPVGRLDQDSSGLIILTNDGELANKLTHPRYHMPKTYHVLVSGKVKQSQLDKLRAGVNLKDGQTLPAEVEILLENKKTTLFSIVLKEGKNRQIRRMCAALNLNLIYLKRVAIGKIVIGNLKPGEFRELTKDEVSQMLLS